MRSLLGAFVLSLVIASAAVQADDPLEDEDYLDFAEKVLSLHRKINSDPDLRQGWKKHVETWNTRDSGPVMPDPVFECDTSIGESDEPPTSVHELRPGDINVISAFGDSITAGNGLGAENVIEVLFENRGESWTVGGDRDLEHNVVTLTNIIRKYNPSVKGYSVCSVPSTHDLAWLNVARGGGTNRHLPGQADELIMRMKEDERIDFENDWKLTTMFVGGNDLCDVCNRWDRYDPAVYKANYQSALDKLYDQVPRMLVNVVVMFDITPLPHISDGDLLCEILQWGFCDCAKNETTAKTLRDIQLQYYDVLHELVDESGRYDDKDDFAVVLQPHMKDMTPPKDEDGEYIREFLSHDCFHPSRLAHQAFTYFLWDTMLIPVGQKPFETADDLENSNVACTTEEHPFIFTNKNSDVEWPPEDMAQRFHRSHTSKKPYKPKNLKKWKKNRANKVNKKANN